MEYIIKNEFSEVLCSGASNKILQVWTKETKKMCEWEFLEQIDNIFSATEVFNSRMLYIDAFDFSYRLNERAVQQILDYLAGCGITFVGIVLCNNLQGKSQILSLINRASKPAITLKFFKTKLDCRLAFSENISA